MLILGVDLYHQTSQTALKRQAIRPTVPNTDFYFLILVSATNLSSSQEILKDYNLTKVLVF